MLNIWIDKFYVLVWIGKIMLPLGEEKLTLWLERSVEVHCEIIVWLLSVPHQLFRELTFKPVCFLMMYDLSACSATRAYDGNLLEDLFSWETGHKERQAWYIQAVYMCRLLWILSLHFGLKIDSFFKMWEVNFSITSQKKSLKIVKKKFTRKILPIQITTINLTPFDNPSSNDSCVPSISFSLGNLILTVYL